MVDMEINRSNPEKEVDIEEKFTDIATGQYAIQSKARSESCVGKHLRSSLQTCKARNNLDKLEGLPKCTKSKSLGKTLNGLIYILNQLLVQSKHSINAIGFISFKDAYGLYCGFFDSAPEEALFRDHLLHEDHGLCVIITVVFGKRYILLKNEEVSVQDFS
ncbi:RNA-directed DNA polymerase from transposon X-element [Paramuricea clavata]|uniref:RNA-directed DNA polymerase from transposon X-element n=1 Tax=Paramuricea clavata TaxID=317549 RepID=A0A7D9IAA1_PARCT|nr:RNA-directed DNA polymerase from transposon X-element [Paramuricea clavata]